MNQLLAALRSARKIELLVILAAVCALIVMGMSGSDAGETISTQEELRMERVLSQLEGAGRVRVMLAADESGAYTGAVAVCPGAEDVRVCLEIQRALHTLTGLELDRIEVVKSK